MKKTILGLLVSCLSIAPIMAESIICYPNPDEAVFTVTVPDNSWEFTPSEDESVDGGYCTLERENTILYFRTVECSEDAIMDAIEDSVDYLSEEFDEVNIEDPSELTIQGYDALASSGTGLDGDGYSWVFGFAWIFIDDQHIAEIWFESTQDEVANQRAASDILNTFTIVD